MSATSYGARRAGEQVIRRVTEKTMMKSASCACRIRSVFADGFEIADDAIGAPDLLADAAYDRGAVGVTVMVLS